ncbi:MAG: ABC transporter permease [Gemmatimonadota bacterium]
MDALLALWQGAFGSAYAILSATLVRATPLLLLGLSVATAFRSGILNIGAEGQLLAGAMAAAAVGLASTGWPSPIAVVAMIIAGIVAGAGGAFSAAALRRWFGVLVVISTIMLNFLALHLVSWLVRGPLQEPTRTNPQSATLPDVAHWPTLVPSHRLHLGFVLGLLLALALWVMWRHTAVGFRLRVVGMGARAAASAGRVAVDRTVMGAFLLSGAIAGLAGASEVGGVTWGLYDGISPGYGYTAIAVALLARLDPLAVVPSAVFFGALEAGAAAMQRDAGVPAVVVQVVVAGVVLAVIALDEWRRARAVRGGADA